MHWLILTLLVVAIDCFNYNDCKIDGGTTYDSNGYTIIHTAGIDILQHLIVYILLQQHMELLLMLQH